MGKLSIWARMPFILFGALFMVPYFWVWVYLMKEEPALFFLYLILMVFPAGLIGGLVGLGFYGRENDCLF